MCGIVHTTDLTNLITNNTQNKSTARGIAVRLVFIVTAVAVGAPHLPEQSSCPPSGAGPHAHYDDELALLQTKLLVPNHDQLEGPFGNKIERMQRIMAQHEEDEDKEDEGEEEQEAADNSKAPKGSHGLQLQEQHKLQLRSGQSHDPTACSIDNPHQRVKSSIGRSIFGIGSPLALPAGSSPRSLRKARISATSALRMLISETLTAGPGAHDPLLFSIAPWVSPSEAERRDVEEELLSWASSVSKAHVPIHMVVVLSKEMKTLVSKVLAQLGMTKVFVFHSGDLVAAVQASYESYPSHWPLKYEIMSCLFRLGLPRVMFADFDVLWARTPFPELRNETALIMTASDQLDKVVKPSSLQYVNAGVLVMRANGCTKRILKAQLKHMLRGNFNDDQAALRHVLRTYCPQQEGVCVAIDPFRIAKANGGPGPVGIPTSLWADGATKPWLFHADDCDDKPLCRFMLTRLLTLVSNETSSLRLALDVLDSGRVEQLDVDPELAILMLASAMWNWGEFQNSLDDQNDVNFYDQLMGHDIDFPIMENSSISRLARYRLAQNEPPLTVPCVGRRWRMLAIRAILRFETENLLHRAEGMCH